MDAPPPPPAAPEAVWRPADVCDFLHISRKGLWEMRRSGRFPQARRLSENRVFWLKSEVLAWLAARPTV